MRVLKLTKIAAIFHGALILFAYTSPLWLDYRLFFIGLLLYYIQIAIFKGCMLTYAQYGTFNTRFSDKIFEPIFKIFKVKLSQKQMGLFLDYLFPVFLVIVCILWQIVFKQKVLVGFLNCC
ncbi:MAG: hypothetical protein UT66_C0018G0026 [candidate division CPR2 bacterium GW2011_GWC1_39_9]|uniref:Uncharacterized protein n=1 Tax=candidate division CPR2 bacterium GW2011_GWC2_39_10 TaxID=1618345 RepID=A0A0G0PX63_UNCC2|nr:MAG: hypothetical protein UT18_C0013G0008 [candidate division CPR2 bacterium GW2011_GWC2_39_10]KKR34687.1 MAG: hypothetical protein UT66_C0018G0026 [candidate division CPR2 bacterium GW2011_GWC1_39_9]